MRCEQTRTDPALNIINRKKKTELLSYGADLKLSVMNYFHRKCTLL
jgi:hypothetical protein